MRHVGRLILLIASLLLAWPAHGGSAPPLDAAAADALLQKIDRTLEAHRWSEALPLIDRYLAEVRRDPIMLYNAACCHAQLGEKDAGAASLFDAVKAGFRDFDGMESDPDLEPLRDHPTYTAILEARDLARERAKGKGTPPNLPPDAPPAQRPDAPKDQPRPATPPLGLDLNDCPQLEEWKRIHGTKHYRFEDDPARRLHYATCLDEATHKEMRDLIEREADWLSKHLFGDAPAYQTLVAVPTPADAKKYISDPDTRGVYEHRMHMLIARDIGEALQHEFVHLMHYGHMERLHQKHPIWIQEGVAALFEAYTLSSEGEIAFLPNTRHNVIFRAVDANNELPWPKLFALSPHGFMDRAPALYPEVRSIFLYLADREKLMPWYQAYTKGFAEDPSGAKALERVFGKPLADIERQWRAWVTAKGPIDDSVRTGDASLGISITETPGGIRIKETLKDSSARAAGLRAGDVIVAIDGKAIRSSRELAVAIASHRVGDTVTVRYRRREEYLESPVTLRPLQPASRTQ